MARRGGNRDRGGGVRAPAWWRRWRAPKETEAARIERERAEDRETRRLLVQWLSTHGALDD